jgi:hypothetical protein
VQSEAAQHRAALAAAHPQSLTPMQDRDVLAVPIGEQLPDPVQLHDVGQVCG